MSARPLVAGTVVERSTPLGFATAAGVIGNAITYTVACSECGARVGEVCRVRSDAITLGSPVPMHSIRRDAFNARSGRS